MLNFKNNFEKFQYVDTVNVFSRSAGCIPKICIAIPTFNRPEFLAKAIDSAVQQISNFDYEIVVVDNGSICNEINTDPVLDIVKSSTAASIRLYRNAKNIGMFGNWNKCIQLASSEYITILNDDDRLSNCFVERACNLIDENIRLFSFPIVVKDQRSLNFLSRVKANIKSYFGIVKRNFHFFRTRYDLIDFFIQNRNHGSLGVVFSKEDALRVGGFNDEYFPQSDYVFFTNLVRLNNYQIVDYKTYSIYTIEVNESMKKEVVIKWAEDGIVFRHQILALYEKYPDIAIKYISLSALIMISVGINFWGINASLEDWKTALNVRNKFYKLQYKFLKIRILLTKYKWQLKK